MWILKENIFASATQVTEISIWNSDNLFIYFTVDYFSSECVIKT